MSYRLRGSKFLLTYSQVPDEFTFTEVQLLLSTFEPVLFLRVARELHLDGGTHYHCAVQFERILDRIITRQLDCCGVHPNIKPKGGKKAWDNACNYCEKDGDFLDIGERTDQEEAQEPSSILRRANEFSSFTEFLCACADEGIQFGYCQAAWNASKEGGETITDGEPDRQYVVSDTLLNRQWNHDTERAVVLIGPAGTGKTSWARAESVKPALFVSHTNDLRSFIPGFHRTIIFDEMSFVGGHDGKGSWPITSQIHLCDWHHKRSIHCRYVNVTIPKNVYKIFTCNDWPLDMNHAAIQRRTTSINLFSN